LVKVSLNPDIAINNPGSVERVKHHLILPLSGKSQSPQITKGINYIFLRRNYVTI